MQSEQGGGDNPKVATSSPDHPEEVSVLVGIGGDQPPIRQYYIHGEQIIDGEAILARQVAVSATQGQSADTGGHEEGAHCRQAKDMRGMIHVTPGAAALDPYCACAGIDAYAPHTREIDHQTAITHREARATVAATAQ